MSVKYVSGMQCIESDEVEGNPRGPLRVPTRGAHKQSEGGGAS